MSTFAEDLRRPEDVLCGSNWCAPAHDSERKRPEKPPITGVPEKLTVRRPHIPTLQTPRFAP